ncbi:MAG TPA: hypothetical protein VG013_05610 [Gemmataceae bacterium]|jgi:hypothetical protein|nr:hypothetical protein [Gemmataceae bacterium]
MVNPDEARPMYRPSGQVDWRSFLAWGLLTLAVSLVMAGGLHLLFIGGWCFLVLIPLVATLPAAGMVCVMVARGHCRNPVLGGLTGLAAAWISYFGSYHIDLVQQRGPAVVHRLDLLPGHFVHRMNTDVEEVRGGHPVRVRGPNANPRRVDWLGNWLMFVLEFGMLSCLGFGVGWRWASKPYCETARCWMTEQSAALPVGTAAALVQALRDGSLPDWADRLPPRVAQQLPYCGLTIHYVAWSEDRAPSLRIYLTVKEVKNHVWPKVLFKHGELAPEELAGLVPLFPALQSLVDHVTPPAQTSHGTDKAASGSGVDVQPVPAPFAGRVITGRHVAMAHVVAVAPSLAGLGLLAGAGVALHHDQLGLAGVMIVLALGILGAVVRMARVPASARYFRQVARRAFRERPDCLVAPDQPGAVFVEVIPRRNWNQMKIESATDMGFLLVDREQGRLLFEGDRERYEVPAKALVACEVEARREHDDNPKADPVYLTVIRAQRAGQAWEAPLLPRDLASGKQPARSSYERAVALQGLIRTLRLDVERRADNSPTQPLALGSKA